MKPTSHPIARCAPILGILLAACGVAAPPPAGEESAVETRVAATLAALERQDATEAPPPTAPPPSETPTPPPTAAPASPQAEICRVVANALNLRYGPGTVYAPPIGILRRGGQLEPLARNANAGWIEVRALSTGQAGWVSASESFVRCDLDLSSLPLGVIPPTPTPSVTPTPPLLQVGAIEGTVDTVVTERVRLEISATDLAVGDQNGDGIDFVRFAILYEGEIVYESVDSTPPYCAIPGDPNCFYVFPAPPRWPNGEVIQQGPHTVRAIVHALDGRTRTVEAEFEVDLP